MNFYTQNGSLHHWGQVVSSLHAVLNSEWPLYRQTVKTTDIIGNNLWMHRYLGLSCNVFFAQAWVLMLRWQIFTYCRPAQIVPWDEFQRNEIASQISHSKGSTQLHGQLEMIHNHQSAFQICTANRNFDGCKLSAKYRVLRVWTKYRYRFDNFHTSG